MSSESGQENPVLFHAPCWRYEVVAGSVLAHEWRQHSRGAACEIEVRRSKDSEDGTPYNCTIHEVKGGSSLSLKLEKGRIMKVRDSERYYLLILGAVHIGIALYSRDESDSFAKVVLESTKDTSIQIASRKKKEHSSKEKHAPEIKVNRVEDVGSSPSSETSASASESDKRSTASDESTIHGEVPEIQAEKTQFRTRRALSRATPSKKPLSKDLVPDAEETSKATTITLKTTEHSGSLSSAFEQIRKEEEEEKKKEEEQKEKKEKEKEKEEEEKEEFPDQDRKSKWELHRMEDSSQEKWRNHKKHFFIVSTSGKPIYSRYGDEQNLAPFMASLMALVSFVEGDHDTLRYFVAGELKVVFLLRGPMIFVAVSRTSESHLDIMRELFYICSQVISILTFTTVSSIFASRADYDLRDLLSPTDHVLLDNLCHLMNCKIGYMMNAFEPLPLEPAVRAGISSAMLKMACPELLYAFLLCGSRLIECVRPRRFTLDPVDFNVIVNFVRNSTSARSLRTWTPICLPMFDERGFLHALVYYLDEDTLLVLLSTKVDAYYDMSECATTLEQDLTKNHLIDAIKAAAATPTFSVSALPVEKENLYHFVYRSTLRKQVIFPAFEGRYSSPREQKRLLRVYQKVRQRARTISNEENGLSIAYALGGGAPTDAVSKVFYQSSRYETIVAFVTKNFELFVTVSPAESKSIAMKACLSVLQWISEHEPELFIPSFPSWS